MCRQCLRRAEKIRLTCKNSLTLLPEEFPPLVLARTGSYFHTLTLVLNNATLFSLLVHPREGESEPCLNASISIMFSSRFKECLLFLYK